MQSALDSLVASSDAARKIIGDEVGRFLPSWGEVFRSYTRAKRPLIDALCPESGRRVFPFTHKPTDAERVAGWRGALVNSGINVDWLAAQAEHAARQPDAAAHQSSMDRAAVKARELANLLAPLAPECERIASYASLTELTDGAVTGGSALCTFLSARNGQSFTRALGAYFRKGGMSADGASRCVDYLVSAAAVKPREGYAVLSANILDLLCCSENCSYTSCHSLDGCHRAGPQQYLHDGCTLVAYYYEETRKWKGLHLPHKLSRSIVHIDRERHSAAFQRHYGQAMRPELSALIRRETACLIARLKDGADAGVPHWFRRDGDKDKRVIAAHGAALAYIDPTVETIQFVRGVKGRPSVRLASTVPCGCCGNELSEPGALVCTEDERETCCRCDDRFDADDGRGEGDEWYCDNCWSEAFTSCNRCGCTLDTEGGDCHYIEGDGDYCERCFDRLTSDCAGCEERIPDADLTDGYCETCLSSHPDCADCGNRHHEDDTHVIDNDGAAGDGDLVCDDCLTDRNRFARLYQRLLNSPRFLRSFGGARIALVWHWSLQAECPWTREYGEALAAHEVEGGAR